VPLSDVWDIPYLNPKAKERVGYPTQKPLLLLERIINLVTNENDLVLDPFCGSGTTCVAAMLAKRQYIGIDESEAAIALAQSRLSNPIKTESDLLAKGRKSFKNANSEALQCLAPLEYNPVQRNRGIDAILREHYQGAPVLVKIQRSTETIAQAHSLLANAMCVKAAKKGVLIQTSEQVDEPLLSQGADNIHIIKTIALSIRQHLCR
jgi:site-specific DNA-methyltransferase (adenine-specific)